ncbi:DedA family protein [Streptomyces hoynatensis]|uniref:DedA family protein n=1 Tax=Streptomyces hoynatensis TaxID=1141874 RepID=A0A3A9ZFW7_9ACTN|nr:VTT domain-containing protein [Streptomyces hoynatensis]RKN47180.1 DedA family protein [Streptomyces hoynatensis]
MDGALWMYALLALTTAPPLVPNAALIASAGALAQEGKLSLPLVLLVVAGSALAGDALVHGAGRLAGPRALRRLNRRPRRRAALAWMAARMHSHGLPFVIGIRFLPSGRLVGGLAAAVVGYPARRYLLGAAIAEAVWASYSVALGYWGGSALHGTWPSLALGTAVSAVVACVAQLLTRLGRPASGPTRTVARGPAAAGALRSGARDAVPAGSPPTA